jgi:hypothetical protein
MFILRWVLGKWVTICTGSRQNPMMYFNEPVGFMTGYSLNTGIH